MQYTIYMPMNCVLPTRRDIGYRSWYSLFSSPAFNYTCNARMQRRLGTTLERRLKDIYGRMELLARMGWPFLASVMIMAADIGSADVTDALQ